MLTPDQQRRGEPVDATDRVPLEDVDRGGRLVLSDDVDDIPVVVRGDLDRQQPEVAAVAERGSEELAGDIVAGETAGPVAVVLHTESYS
jgi:hypothetical protein